MASVYECIDFSDTIYGVPTVWVNAHGNTCRRPVVARN